MLVSAVTNVFNGKGVNGFGIKNNHAGVAASSRNNYSQAKREKAQEQDSRKEMFHKIALWKEFCEKKLITDESQVESFNYLA